MGIADRGTGKGCIVRTGEAVGGTVGGAGIGTIAALRCAG